MKEQTVVLNKQYQIDSIIDSVPFQRKPLGIALAMAAAGLFATASMTPAVAAKHEGMVHCQGVNGCKGKSDCATASNVCKGQNACKGKGWVGMSAKDCAAKGGKVDGKKGSDKGAGACYWGGGSNGEYGCENVASLAECQQFVARHGYGRKRWQPGETCR